MDDDQNCLVFGNWLLKSLMQTNIVRSAMMLSKFWSETNVIHSLELYRQDSVFR